MPINLKKSKVVNCPSCGKNDMISKTKTMFGVVLNCTRCHLCYGQDGKILERVEELLSGNKGFVINPLRHPSVIRPFGIRPPAKMQSEEPVESTFKIEIDDSGSVKIESDKDVLLNVLENKKMRKQFSNKIESFLSSNSRKSFDINI